MDCKSYVVDHHNACKDVKSQGDDLCVPFSTDWEEVAVRLERHSTWTTSHCPNGLSYQAQYVPRSTLEVTLGADGNQPAECANEPCAPAALDALDVFEPIDGVESSIGGSSGLQSISLWQESGSGGEKQMSDGSNELRSLTQQTQRQNGLSFDSSEVGGNVDNRNFAAGLDAHVESEVGATGATTVGAFMRALQVHNNRRQPFVTHSNAFGTQPLSAPPPSKRRRNEGSFEDSALATCCTIEDSLSESTLAQHRAAVDASFTRTAEVPMQDLTSTAASWAWHSLGGAPPPPSQPIIVPAAVAACQRIVTSSAPEHVQKLMLLVIYRVASADVVNLRLSKLLSRLTFWPRLPANAVGGNKASLNARSENRADLCAQQQLCTRVMAALDRGLLDPRHGLLALFYMGPLEPVARMEQPLAYTALVERMRSMKRVALRMLRRNKADRVLLQLCYDGGTGDHVFAPMEQSASRGTPALRLQ